MRPARPRSTAGPRRLVVAWLGAALLVAGPGGATAATAATTAGTPPAPLAASSAAAVVSAAGQVSAAASVPASIAGTDRIVVTWTPAGLGGGGQAARIHAMGSSGRVDAISAAAGHRAAFVRPLGGAAVAGVYRLDAELGANARGTLRAIEQVPGVASVDPDVRVEATDLPNDTYAGQLWGLNGPADGSAYGLDVRTVWPTTRGAGVVVAVVDTGLVAHTDLAGQSVAGYDMISDPFVANDGDGRDADASDPGDGYAADECGAGSPARDSSWHGTHVAGTIVALAGNSVGVYGGAPDAKVQPVRVLGKCGGYLADVADGVTWASGGAVSGVPANPTPARVINMSLGGSGSCPDFMQTAITTARSHGAVVAVAAGNSGTDASTFTPANCTGVLPVAAVDGNGLRASFSNYGATVSVAAAGVGVWSTVDSGTAGPVGPAYASKNGTSMATPHVAAVAALLLGAKPSAGVSAIETAIKGSAKPFPADPNGGCPSLGCGSGIVNAPAALKALLNDSTPPTAVLTRPAASTSAATLTYGVAFSEFVSGLTAADFSTSGSATGCVVGAPAGASAGWSVDVTGCSDGSVVLTLAAGSVQDAALNPGPAKASSAASVTVDRTPPASSGSIAADYTLGTSFPVAYVASDGGTGLASVRAFASTSPDLSSPTACGSVTSSAGSGTITCTIPAVDGTYHVFTRATDAAGNVEAAPLVADDSIVRDTTRPAVTFTTPSSPTRAATLGYGLAFSEPVTGLDAGDFGVSGTGCSVGTPTGSGDAWSVDVTGCAEGPVTLVLLANTVKDAAGVSGPLLDTAAPAVTVDRTAPALSSIGLEPGSDSGRSSSDRLTKATSLSYGLVFDEPVSGLTADALGVGGTAAGCVAGAPSGSGATWSVSVTGCSEGTVILSLGSGTVADIAGNAGPAATGTAATVTIDRTAPSPVPALAVSGPARIAGTDLEFTLTGSEPLDCGTLSTTAGVDFTFQAIASLGAITGSGTTVCTIPATSSIAAGQTGPSGLGLASTFAVADDAGNSVTSPATAPVTTVVDRTPPSVAVDPHATVTSVQPSYTLRFGEPVSGLAADDLTAGPGCTVGSIAEAAPWDGSAWTVTLAGCPDGQVVLGLRADAVTDGVGQAGPVSASTFAAVTLDRAAPLTAVPSVGPRTGVALSGTSIPVSVSLGGSDAGGSGIASYRVERSTNGGATWVLLASAATGSSFASTMPSTGSTIFRVRARDRAGNLSAMPATGRTSAGRLVQQWSSSVAYRGTWTGVTYTSYSGGSARYAKGAGASASYTFTGRSVAFVTTRATSRGKVKIYVGGVWQATIDLYRSSTQYRSVAWQRTWSTTGTRTVKVVVVGTYGRPRVDTDAFVVIR